MKKINCKLRTILEILQVKITNKTPARHGRFYMPNDTIEYNETSPFEINQIVAHELGHWLGYWGRLERPTVLNYAYASRIEKLEEELIAHFFAIKLLTDLNLGYSDLERQIEIDKENLGVYDYNKISVDFEVMRALEYLKSRVDFEQLKKVA